MSELKKVELTINTDFYLCKSQNKTKLSLKKEFIDSAIESSKLEDLVFFLAQQVFEDKNFYKRQKIVALTNLVRDLKSYVNDRDKFTLNLVIKNFKKYHKIEQEDEYYILKEDRMFYIQVQIKRAFKKVFNEMLKDEK